MEGKRGQTKPSQGDGFSAPGKAAAAVVPHEVSGDEVFSKLLQLVRAVQSGMQDIDGRHGLSGAQLWILWQISAQPGLRVTELAEAQHIHPSTASNLLDKLEARGLVRRERSSADSRVVRLYLEEPGLALADSIPGPMQGRLRRALGEIPPPVLEGLREGLNLVLERVNVPRRRKTASPKPNIPR